MRIISVRDFIYEIINYVIVIVLISLMLSIMCGLYSYSNDKRINSEIPEGMKEKLDEVFSLREAYINSYNDYYTSGICDMNADYFYFGRIRCGFVGLPQNNVNDCVDEVCDESLFAQIVSDTGIAMSPTAVRALTAVWSQKEGEEIAWYFDFKSDNKEQSEVVARTAREILSGRLSKWFDDEHFSLGETVIFANEETFLQDAKNSMLKRCEDKKEAMDDAENSLSSEEIKYYTVYYLGEKYTVNIYSIAKNIVILFVIFMFVQVSFVFLYYIFNGKIKDAEEIKYEYNLYVIGTLRRCEEKNNILKCEMVQHRYRFDSAEYVKGVLEHFDKKFVLCAEESLDKQMISDICMIDNVKPYIHLDSQAQNMVKTVDGVILVVEIGKTKSIEFERELDVCAANGINVLGVIAVV